MNSNLILKFYNAVSGCNAESVEDIPPKSLEFLMLLDENDIKKPFARLAIYNGKSEGKAAQIVGWDRFRVRRVL